MKVSSLLKKNLFKTYFPSSTFLAVDFMDSENTVVRSKKIRIYPKDRGQVEKWLGLTRYWYNQAVEHLQKDRTKASLAEVRKAVQVRDAHPDWAFDCPQRIREHAFTDAVNSVKNAKKKTKTKGGVNKVKFRSKKDVKQRFGFDNHSLKEDFVFSQKKMKTHFYATEGIRTDKEGTEIVRENGRYFLVIPREINVKKPENQRLSSVSVDPGVRTFATFFSPEVFGKVGEGDFGRIMRLCHHLDQIYSKMSKAKCKQKQNLKKASQKMRWKIKDLVSELHHKFAHFLVTRFDTIFLPTFETSQMVTKLRSKTARMMLTFKHYDFQQFLIAKAEEYSAKVVLVNEAYTSKTCSFCGKIHKIGSKKVLKCSCGVDVDRDLNGARGIMLRALAVTPRQDLSAIVNNY